MGVSGGWEYRADGSMGRKGAWGGWEYGAEASMGRTGVRGRREAGAEGSMGRTGVVLGRRAPGWGGRDSEYGAEGSMGRKGVWGARLRTPRHTDLHFDPQATTFLSPPGGIYLIFSGGHNLVMFHLMKLKKRPCARQQTESVQRNAPRLTGGTPATRRRKVGGRSGSPHRGRRARRGVSGAPNRRAVRPARGGAGALHGLLINSCPDSMLQWI